VLPLTHVVDFFAHEFTRLGAGRFAFGLVFGGASLGSFFGHNGCSLVDGRCVNACRARANPASATCTSRERHEQHFADAALLGEGVGRWSLGEWEAIADRDFE